jgi:hypothetical protein
MNEEVIIGNIVIYHVTEGEKIGRNNNQDVAPAIVNAVWPDEYPESGQPGLNLNVFTDGTDIMWKPSVKFGTDPGQWSYKK